MAAPESPRVAAPAIAARFFSGMSATIAPVVKSRQATPGPFCGALRVTSAGSITPSSHGPAGSEESASDPRFLPAAP